MAAAEQELDLLTSQLGRDPRRTADHADALDRFLALGGDDFDARARAVCGEVGLGAGHAAPTTELSGGERARAALAAILLARFDVYLLDEPTNDLDFDGLERLERFLASRRGSLVVVSHDRELLDRTVSRIVELEEGTRRVRDFAGGWSDYEAARERARAAHYRRFEEAETRRTELDDLLRARRGQARAGDSLGKRTGGADRRGTQALRSKVAQAKRALERVEHVDKPWEPWKLHLDLEPTRRSGDVVVRLEQAVVRRGDLELGPLDLAVGRGDRVVVVGPNGSGKTSLLGAVLGSVRLASGRRYVGPGVVFGELDQARSGFSSAAPVLDGFRELPVPEARSLLAKFGLGADDVRRPATSLSPGERTRAELALLVARRVNCLVLDEPTNHLDIPGIEELESALRGYPGAILLVSHDRRFLSGFEATRTITLGK